MHFRFIFSVYFREEYQEIMPSVSHVRDWFIMQWNVSSLFLYVWYFHIVSCGCFRKEFLKLHNPYFGLHVPFLFISPRTSFPSTWPLNLAMGWGSAASSSIALSRAEPRPETHFGTLQAVNTRQWLSETVAVHSFNCLSMHLWLRKFIQKSILCRLIDCGFNAHSNWPQK